MTIVEGSDDETPLEILPHLLEDSGYVVPFGKGSHRVDVKVFYMHPDVYLRLLRGPSLMEKWLYRWWSFLEFLHLKERDY